MVSQEDINMNENMIDALHKNGMLYFLLGSIISADSIFSKEDAENSMKTLTKIEKELKSSNLNDTEKTEYTDMIKKCYGVLEDELKKYNK